MSSPFGDDEQFPNRPDTLDFWRLAQVNMKLDGAMEAGVPIEQTLRGLIDERTVLYTARHRIDSMLAQTQVEKQVLDPVLGRLMLVSALMSAYVSGIVAGIEFEREGGHRDG